MEIYLGHNGEVVTGCTVYVNKYQAVPNLEFKATLYLDCANGGNKVSFVADPKGTKPEFRTRIDVGGYSTISLSMFLKDFVELVRTGKIEEQGKITGIWTFCRKGRVYGVRWVRES